MAAKDSFPINERRCRFDVFRRPNRDSNSCMRSFSLANGRRSSLCWELSSVPRYHELHLVCKNKSTQLCKPQNMNIITTLLVVNSNSKKKKSSTVYNHTIFVQCTGQSCKSARTEAYSNDLRWRMVYQRCMLGLTYEEIVSQLSVNPSTVWCAVQRFEEHGMVVL